MTRGAQVDTAREQEEHRVALLENKKSTGWRYLITKGAQGGTARSQEEHRVAVPDDKRSTG